MGDYEYTTLRHFDPDDLDDPNGDAATLSALAATGSNMSKPTHFIHYLRFGDEGQARAVSESLASQLGYRVEAFGPSHDVAHWNIRAETDREPTLENVRRMSQVMRVAAERYGGDYDGWEAAVQVDGED